VTRNSSLSLGGLGPRFGHQTPESALSPDRALTLPWLRRLRWTAVIGQTATVLGTVWLLKVPLPLLPVFVCIGLTALSNLGLQWVPSGHGEAVPVLTAVMAVDVLLLTALLHFTGGPHNPFTRTLPGNVNGAFPIQPAHASAAYRASLRLSLLSSLDSFANNLH